MIVRQVERHGKFAAAIKTHAGGVDANGGHVAAHGTQGIAHAEGFGRTLIIRLREAASIVAALREKSHCKNDEYRCEYGFLHGLQIKRLPCIEAAKVVFFSVQY